MRLGQLARRYDISTQEVNSYIKKVRPTLPKLHPNDKLDPELEAELLAYYNDFLGDPGEAISTDRQEAIPETTSYANEQTLQVENETAEFAKEEIEANKEPEQAADSLPQVAEIKGESIATDRFLELLEQEDASVDLSKITHIRASKKELSGLKVVGKIEIETTKNEKKGSNEDKRASERPRQQHESRILSEEEKEKRRLIAKQKKEAYEQQQQKKQQQQEERRKKARRKANYEKKLERAAKSKKQLKSTPSASQSRIISSEEYLPQQPKPKTLLGRFWRWLNSY